MKRFTFPIIVEADPDGYFASCPTLQGCYCQGGTHEEAVINIKDAVCLHIEDRLAAGIVEVEPAQRHSDQLAAGSLQRGQHLFVGSILAGAQEEA